MWWSLVTSADCDQVTSNPDPAQLTAKSAHIPPRPPVASATQQTSLGRQRRLGRADNHRRKPTMRLITWGLHAAAIWSFLLPTVCAAHDTSLQPHDGGLRLKVTGKRNLLNARHSKRGNIEGTSTLSNSADVSYYTNITLGDVAFSVLIGVCDLPPL